MQSMSILSLILIGFFSLTSCVNFASAHSGETHVEEEKEPVDCSTYVNEIMLPSEEANIKIEYVSTNTTLSVRMSSDQQSFLSFGISTSAALMEGSEAVIGTTPNDVQMYSLVKAFVEVKESSKQTLLNSSFTQDGDGSVLEFTQLLDDGINKKIDGFGKNVFIWAVGRQNNVLFGHKASGETHGALELDLSPCDDSGDDSSGFVIVEKNDKELLAVHGKMAIAAFAVFMPLAAVIALVRKLLPQPILNKELWFVLHAGFNAISYLLIVGLFAISIIAVNQTNAEHFHNAHQIIGLIVFILVTIQVIWAIVRPSKNQVQSNEENNGKNVVQTNSEPKTEKSLLRTTWESSHRAIAVITLALGFYQIHSGLSLYRDIYESADYVPLFWYIMGSLIAVSVLVVFFAKQR